MALKGRNSEATWVNTNKGWVSAYYIDAEGDLTKLPVNSASSASLSSATGLAARTPNQTLAATKVPKPSSTKTPFPTSAPNCDPSYPGVCTRPYPPDLDCNQINYCQFRVLYPDPHGFDGDGDGWGCERCP